MNWKTTCFAVMARRCEHPGCTTYLSTYNRTNVCSIHEGGDDDGSAGVREPRTPWSPDPMHRLGTVAPPGMSPRMATMMGLDPRRTYHTADPSPSIMADARSLKGRTTADEPVPAGQA